MRYLTFAEAVALVGGYHGPHAAQSLRKAWTNAGLPKFRRGRAWRIRETDMPRFVEAS